jgi:hypothetical protein
MHIQKKKIAAVVLICTIVLSLLSTISVSAAEVIFTVINDNPPIALNDASMPVSMNGVIYVPYRLFNNFFELGTRCLMSDRVVLVSTEARWLKFDLVNNKTTDHNQNEKGYKAIYYNDTVYLPAEATCAFFGLTYSYITSQQSGPIVRIKTTYVLDDNAYTNATSEMMRNNLAAYLSSVTPESGQPATPLPATPSPPDYSDVEVYISICGLESGLGDQVLSLLSNVYSCKACFFLTAQEIKENPELVREILGTGNRIGLLVGEDVENDYMEAASCLKSAAEVRTIFIASLLPVSEEMARKAREMGLVFWFDGTCGIQMSDSGYNVYEKREELRNAAAREDLIFRVDEDVFIGMGYILNDLNEGHYQIKNIRETDWTCLDFFVPTQAGNG